MQESEARGWNAALQAWMYLCLCKICILFS